MPLGHVMLNSFAPEEVRTDGKGTLPQLRLSLRRVPLSMLRLLGNGGFANP